MKSTFFHLLFFRAKQALRATKDIGLGNLLLLSPIIVVFFLGILQHISTSHSVWLSLGLLGSLLGIHSHRKDHFYLQQIGIPTYLFFVVEYTILFLFFGLAYAWFDKWSSLGILGLGILLLPTIRPGYLSDFLANKKVSGLQLHWIPLDIFEWRGGLRKNLSGPLFFYILGLCLSYYTITVPIIILLLGLIIASFFSIFENKDILLAINQKQRLLKVKVGKSLLLFNLLLLPHYLLFLIFSWQYWFVLPIMVIIANMIITFSICLKYKSYRFGSNKVTNNFPMAIFIACWSYPYLWPIPVIMLIVFWRQAQQNLIHHYA